MVDDKTRAHLCEICGAPMRLVRITPKVGPHPELQTFRCKDCGHVSTKEDDD